MNPTPIAGTETQAHESHAQFLAIYPLARRAAGVRTAAAIARALVPPTDREDMEQEAVSACWLALPNFDPRRASLRTYVECVVASRIASVVRATHRLRARRPLDLAANNCANPALGRHELRIDMERVLAVCNHDERRLAFLLMEYTPSETSRILGVARSTVYEHIQKLRVQFTTAGLSPGSCAKRARRRAAQKDAR